MAESEFLQPVSGGGMLTFFLVVNILVMWTYVIYLHWNQNRERSKLIDRLMIKEFRMTFNPEKSSPRPLSVQRQYTDEELYEIEQAEMRKKSEK